jgi:hypothetical protein
MGQTANQMDTLMDYSVLFQQTFEELGFDVVGVWNVFNSEYDWQSGWQCRLPVVNFKSNTVLLMYLQDRVTVVNGRVLELEKIIQQYSENLEQIVAVHMHPGLDEIYSGPIKLIEFSNHNYALMNSLQSQIELWQHIPQQTKTMSWQCLNGRSCQHRRRAVDVLQTWTNGILSYGQNIPLPQWDYGTYPGSSNEENFIRLAQVYGSCAFNIVTETLYDEYPGLYSEKTLLAFLAHQIPIMIGTPRLVEKLRLQGFDMFDDIVDHGYDLAPNDQRVEIALESNKQVILNQYDTSRLLPRFLANQELALVTLPDWYGTNFKIRAKAIAEQLLTC